MNHRILILIFCALPHFVRAQGNLIFEKLPSEIGFTNSGVNDILEDHRGFLWMATWSGLAKYDGYSVKMYRQLPGEEHGLKSNKVTQIFEDSKQRLWIGTNYSGFYCYNQALDNFEQFRRDPKNPNTLSNDNVLAITEDSKGMLWIGTENGLNLFDPETRHFTKFEHNPSDPFSLSHNFVYAIAETPDGSLWVGTEEGLNRMPAPGNNGRFYHYDLLPEEASAEDKLTHNFVYKIIPSVYHSGIVWICTSNGLKKVHFSKEDPEYFKFDYYGHDKNDPYSLGHPFIPDVLEEDESTIWVATYFGLDLLNVESKKALHFTPSKNIPNSIESNIVMCLSKDRTDNLWLGFDKGVNKLKLNAKAFQNITPNTGDNTSNNVMCLTPSSQMPGMWVGSRGGGLNFLRLDESGNLALPAETYHFATPKLRQQADFIVGLLLDREGWLWLATDGAGVIRIKEKNIPRGSATLSDFQQFTRSDRISGDYVTSILQSEKGDIWIGYWDKGIDRYDPKTGAFDHFSFTKDSSINLQSFPIVHLLESSEGGENFLWLGTRGGGIYKVRFDTKQNCLTVVHHLRSGDKPAGSLSNNFINGFFKNKKGEIWVGTDNGLNVLDGQTGLFTSFYERDGLRNSTIQSILEDANDNIWISTQQGISSLNFLDSGEISVKNFDAFDGLQDNFFNDDAAAVTAGGHLIFGGVNGMSVFKPSEIKTDNIAPKIAITDFRLSNQSVPIGKMDDGRTLLSKNITEAASIELSHRDNVVSFGFTGLHFGEPKKIQYAYQLEGFNPDWVYTDASQRMAHYTNLPYDDFVFKVKAANGDGVWSEPVSLHLTVNPPFWLTGWAYAFYTLFVAGLIYLGIRITKLRAEFRHSLELERVEREKLEEVNQMKLQFFTNISHELRTPLTLIISPLEQLLQNPADKVSHKLFTRMHFNANRLLNMINQLLDIRKNEAGLMNLHVAEGDLSEFGKEITASFKNLAKQRGIQLQFSTQASVMPAWFDHDQLEKVLFNLLSNAFKFTKDGGRVAIHITGSADENSQQNGLENHFQISVTDTGVGIPSGQLNNIFERFYQVEKSQEWARKSGTGIGLSLAKMIVEKHKGKIEVESEEGKGTHFKIFLQKGNAHFSKAELLPAESSLGKLPSFTIPEAFTETEAASMAAAPLATENENREKPLILLVEDNPDIRSYLRENLETDYRIGEASDGVEGLESALETPPDLIIADIAMPRMDGIELCSKIKTTLETCHVPVILLTARTSLVFKVDGLETGADDYITKPFHMRLLAARIKNLINNRHALREHFAKTYDLSPSGLVLNSLDEQMLTRIKSEVEKHMDDSDYSVDSLAFALNMSRAKLYRKLKSLTGKSPNQIIRSFRLKRAAQLLETGEYNVSDVTFMVGYNDLKSFREQFKKEFGVNPSGYSGED